MKRWLIPALVVLVMAPIVALATGTLTIPNTLGSLPAGQANLSLLDANWAAIRSCVNTREVTFGLLSARPAAGTAGRYYYATDAVAYYVDNGSTWLQVGGSITGVYAVRGLAGANNSANPTTRFDLSADQVALRSTTDNSIVVRTNTGTLTQNIETAGSAANGRDQAAAYSTNVWLHLYFIWNGTTLASLSSTVAPPTGPTLPTGYTHWAYAGPVRYGDAPGLIRTRWRGATMYYDVATRVMHNGANTTETTISVASAVAPNATSMGIFFSAIDSAAGTPELRIRTVSGSNYLPPIANLGGGALLMYWESRLPNISQQFFYQWSSAPTTGASASVTNAGIPNGGE